MRITVVSSLLPPNCIDSYVVNYKVKSNIRWRLGEVQCGQKLGAPQDK